MLSFPLQTVHFSSECGKISCERNWKWNRSEDPFVDFDLWYVWSGKGSIILNGQEQAIERNQCYLFRPGDRIHAWHDPDHPLTVTYIHFTASEKLDELTNLPAYRMLTAPFYFETYLERFIQVVTIKEIHYTDEAKLLLNLLLLAFEREALTINEDDYRKRHPHYLIMNQIAAAIRENPGNTQSIAELAEQAYLSPRYFSLQFKEVMGQTIESYMIEKKIERAEYLLRQHGMTVGEVADALGYQNIYYFSKQFKKITGINPSKV